MSSDISAERIAALARKWNEVEGLLKKGEHAHKEVIIPAINELRYAGRRFVDGYEAHVRGDFKESEEHFKEAEEFLNKAKHEILDTILCFTSEKAQDLRDRIGEANAVSYFKDYGKLLALIEKIESQTQLSRETRKERDSVYSEMLKEGGDLWRLCELSDSFSASVPGIEQTMKERKKEWRIKILVSALISFFSGLLAAYVFGLF